jgi:hypothetical protein
MGSSAVDVQIAAVAAFRATASKLLLDLLEVFGGLTDDYTDVYDAR